MMFYGFSGLFELIYLLFCKRVYKCVRCNYPLNGKDKESQCFHCGQPLDWSYLK